MSEPIKKLKHIPEGYNPKTPEIASVMKEEAKKIGLENTDSNLNVEGDMNMKKIIENMIPNVIDCQGILGAIFASLIASQTNLPEGMAKCYNDFRKTGNKGDLCTLCGNCPGHTLKEKIHTNFANEYAFVCGEVLTQFDMTERNKHWKEKVDIVSLYGDPVDFLMGYSGYTYKSYNKTEEKEFIFNEIKKSINQGIPVIFRYEPIYMYVLITGYNDENMSLYGYDGTWDCSFMQPAPDSYENRLFCASNWYESMECMFILGERCEPSVTLDNVIARNVQIMKPAFEEKYYDKAVEYILNDDNFKDENNNLATQAQLISSFIDYSIGGRSAVSWYMFLCLGYGADYLYYPPDSECDEKYKKAFDRIAGCCCDLHEISWVAWRGVGTHEEKGNEIIRRLADPFYRKMLAGLIRLIGMKDKQIYETLCELSK